MPGRGTLRFFFTISLVIIICWLLKTLKFLFLPLVLAVFAAILLNPIVSWLSRRKVPRVAAVVLTMLLAGAVLFLAGSIVSRSIIGFGKELPRYETRIKAAVEKVRAFSHTHFGRLTNGKPWEALSDLSLGPLVGFTLSAFMQMLTYALFTFVFALFFLIGAPAMPDKIRRAFSSDQAQSINTVVQGIGGQIQRYIAAKTFTSLITGGSMIGICLAFGVDFPVTWGFLTFLANWVPTVGVFTAAIPPPVLVLIQYGSWMKFIWVIVALTVVLQLLGSIIEPWILGDSVNLSPLAALVSLIFWGWLWGPAGMIVAVPITALIKSTCDNVESLKPVGVLMSAR